MDYAYLMTMQLNVIDSTIKVLDKLTTMDPTTKEFYDIFGNMQSMVRDTIKTMEDILSLQEKEAKIEHMKFEELLELKKLEKPVERKPFVDPTRVTEALITAVCTYGVVKATHTYEKDNAEMFGKIEGDGVKECTRGLMGKLFRK